MLENGQQISRYKIISPIGAGGMGEVYLAQDVRLKRNVALKILPEIFASDMERLHRFEQEALAVSALNHPNILTIHEFGADGEIQFLVSEYVEGETLREKLKSEELGLIEALGIAEQLAFALSAAHTAGILHRDLKPENIMIRRDGIVKVLDFGLAKLTEKKEVRTDAEAETRALVKTNPGVVMGTAAYMSPEQAKGKKTDERTDVWSLGIVLYEMISGTPPFSGETMNDVIASILKTEAPLLSHSIVDVPIELSKIVSKCLRKDRDERYQNIKDLQIDLKDLRKELESALRFSSSNARNSNLAGEYKREANTQILTEDRLTDAAVAPVSTNNLPDGTANSTSSAEYLVKSVKRHKKGVIVALSLLVIALAGAGYGIYKLTAKENKVALSFQSAKFTRLTSSGKVTGAAISPDGKYVAHVVDEGGQQSLWIRQTATSSNVQIVPAAELYYTGLTFSPDGNYVYYSVYETDSTGILYQVPALGGAPRKLLTGIRSAVSFSPDGKQIAFYRVNNANNSLMIANADGSGERELAARGGDEGFFRGRFSALSWSPDGKTIAGSIVNLPKNYMTVIVVPVETGEVKEFTSQKWYEVKQVTWLSDGSGVLVTAETGARAGFKIWRISYPSGEVQKITNDLNNYLSASLTADSNALATVQSEQISNLWVMPANDPARATQITRDRSVNFQITWTPDGRIIYNSNASGNYDLYLTDSGGNNVKQLTANSGWNGDPSVSPDGRSIVFMSDRTGPPQIWRMDIDGGNQTQLTNEGFNIRPQLSPDGQWIVYASSLKEGWYLWKIPVGGGQPVQLTGKESDYPVFSPDGKQIACYYWEELNAPTKLAIFSTEGGEPIKTLAPTLPRGRETNLRWMPSGKALVYGITRSGVSNLWAQPIDGAQPKQLTNFTSDRIFWFEFSRDGKQLAVSRGTQTSDVVLISNFK